MNKVFQNSLQMILANEGETEFIGRVAYTPLTEFLVAKTSFATNGTHEVYEVVKIEVINKEEGVVDTLNLIIGETCGLLNIGGLNKTPHIWRSGFDRPFEWYGQRPNLSLIRKEVDKYFEIWRS